MVSVDALSYTVIGLTSNTFYFVNVTASNVCCGEGENGTTNVTTNMRLVTELLPTATITASESIARPT